MKIVGPAGCDERPRGNAGTCARASVSEEQRVGGDAWVGLNRSCLEPVSVNGCPASSLESSDAKLLIVREIQAGQVTQTRSLHGFQAKQALGGVTRSEKTGDRLLSDCPLSHIISLANSVLLLRTRSSVRRSISAVRQFLTSGFRTAVVWARPTGFNLSLIQKE